MATGRCVEMQRIGDVLLASNRIGACRLGTLGVVRGTHDNDTVRVVRTDLRNHRFGILLNRVPTREGAAGIGVTRTAAVFIKRFVVQFIKNMHVALLLHVTRDIAKERLRTGSILVGAMGMVVHNNVDTCRGSIVDHRLCTGFVQVVDRRTHHVSAPVIGDGLYGTFGKELFEAPVVPEEAHTAQNVRLTILVDDVKTFKR